MTPKKKPRSRTVRLCDNKAFQVERDSFNELFLWLGNAHAYGLGAPEVDAEVTPAQLRKIAKACLEMAGDE